MSMEYFIGDSIVYEDPFQANRLQAENIYLTDTETMESYSYTNIKSSSDSQFQASTSYSNDSVDNQFNTATDYNNDSWDSHFPTAPYENPDVMNWNGQDCVEWALRVCYKHSFDPNLINTTDFRSLTGQVLVNYTQYDFCTFLDVSYGTIFYQEFQDLLEMSGLASHNPGPGSLSSAPDNDYQPLEDPDIVDLSMEMPIDIESFERFLSEEADFGMTHFENTDNPVFQDGPLVIKTEMEDYSYIDNKCHVVPGSPQPDTSFPDSPQLDVLYPSSPQSDVLYPSSPQSDVLYPASPQSDMHDGGNILGKIKTPSRKRVRGPKNWEYLMRMLVDRSYNPSVIRWEDESAFTFRIVKPTIVAQRWGMRSNKPNLTYDNFARGLRYHYTTGALEAVSERQLVYRCGPKSQDFLKRELHYKVAR